MADNTAMNSQITDAVTQTNVKVVGESPAIAIAHQILSLSHAHALMAYNAVSSQHHNYIVSLSSVANNVLLEEDTSALESLSSKVSHMEQSINNQFKTLEAMIAKLRQNAFG